MKKLQAYEKKDQIEFVQALNVNTREKNVMMNLSFNSFCEEGNFVFSRETHFNGNVERKLKKPILKPLSYIFKRFFLKQTFYNHTKFFENLSRLRYENAT